MYESIFSFVITSINYNRALFCHYFTIVSKRHMTIFTIIPILKNVTSSIYFFKGYLSQSAMLSDNNPSLQPTHQL